MLERLLQPEGGQFHYNPIKDEDTDLEYRLASTKILYAEFYNTSPPAAVWGKEGKINIIVVSPTKQKATLKIRNNTPISAMLNAVINLWNLSNDHCLKTIDDVRVGDDWTCKAKDGCQLYLKPNWIQFESSVE